MKKLIISNLFLTLVLAMAGCASTKKHEVQIIDNGMVIGTPMLKEILFKVKTEQVQETGNTLYPKMYYRGKETIVFGTRDTLLVWRKIFGQIRGRANGPYVVTVESAVRGGSRWRVFNIETGEKLSLGVKMEGSPEIISSPNKQNYYVESRFRDKRIYYSLSGKKLGSLTGNEFEFKNENTVESTFCTKSLTSSQKMDLCTITELNLGTGEKSSTVLWR